MYNKTTLIGRLGNDPEIRFTPNQTQVATMSVATTESWKDKTTGERKERTEWHRVVIFGKLAEIVGDHLKKGALVLFEGPIRTRKWQGQDGVERYSTEIHADEMKMLPSGSAKNGSAPTSATSAGTPAATASPTPSTPPAGMHPTSDDYLDDDDIPF